MLILYIVIEHYGLINIVFVSKINLEPSIAKSLTVYYSIIFNSYGIVNDKLHRKKIREQNKIE